MMSWSPKQALAEEVRVQRDAVGSDVGVLARIRTGKMSDPKKSTCCSICKLRFIRNWAYLGCSLRLIVREIPIAGWKPPCFWSISPCGCQAEVWLRPAAGD